MSTDNVKCREITDADVHAVVDCLARNFRRRSRRFWHRSVMAIGARPQVLNYPRYGNLLECNGKVVGVLLTIYHNNHNRIQCNLSSWCVDNEYRSYAIMLNRVTVKDKTVTYTNVSSAPHTRTTIEAFRFKRYADGQMFAIPLLSKKMRIAKARVIEFNENVPEAQDLSESDRRMLSDHKAMGMQALIGIFHHRVVPIVLKWRRLWKHIVPTAQLIYCRSEHDIHVFAHAIGCYCLQHGRLGMVVSANAHVPGLVGKYIPNYEPLYFYGARIPDPMDLTYTELGLLN